MMKREAKSNLGLLRRTRTKLQSKARERLDLQEEIRRKARTALLYRTAHRAPWLETFAPLETREAKGQE